MKSKKINGIFSIVFYLLVPGSACAIDDLVFSGIKGSMNHKIGAVILKEAYKRIEIDIRTIALPAKRALVMSNSGEFDGEVQRIDEMERQYPNLVKVPEPILYLESSVFVKDPGIRVEVWDDLKLHRIGVPRGIEYLEEHTKGMNRIFIKTHETLFYLLDAGRIDLVVIASNYGREFLRNHPEMNIRMLKPPILKVPLFHYLHRKHKTLIPRITESIRQMRQEGMIDCILADTSTGG